MILRQIKSLRVAVLMGGPSGEHAVSVSSGKEVVRALTELGHKPVPILITQQQTWHLLNAQELLSSKASLNQNSESSMALLPAATSLVPLTGVKDNAVDVVFIAMHGPYGEDGKIQALLELLHLPYTGSAVLASAMSMDKVQFRRVMKAEGISIPESCTFTNESIEEIQRTVATEIGTPPLVVKPSDQGSSIGVSIVHSWKELQPAVVLARNSSQTILVDRYIEGRELTVGVIGTTKPQALPVTEIIPEGEFFDYNAKYLSTATQEICPADLEPRVASELQRIAIQVFRTVGAAGFSRIDFLLDAQNRPYVLEINTIPGMTPASLLPKAAEAAGMEFATLIQIVLEDALKVHA